MKRITLVLFLFLIFQFPLSVQAETERLVSTETRPVGKGLIVAPTRMEFTGRIRSKIFKVVNRGSTPNTFRISFVPLLKKDKGQDAQAWVKFSPRRVKVKPGRHQTVRVVIMKPRGLKPGTYTARMMIRAIPPPPPPRKMKEIDDNISVMLDIVYSVTIPIIIHHGS